MIAQAIAEWVGIGLRGPHYDAFLAPSGPQVDWLEVHAENHFEPDRLRHEKLRAIAGRYPISIHGVALSIGSAEGVDPDHLERLAMLVDDIKPCLVSEHLAWCRAGEIYLNDLLPVPLMEDALDLVARNVDQVQRRLGRTILIENPSGYMHLEGDTMTEGRFLSRLVARTGCGLLLDVNNLFVSHANLGHDCEAWMDEVPITAIGEIHLAGNEPDTAVTGLLIDTHGRDISNDVWALYESVIARIGPRPTIIERDSNIPPLADLMREAAYARAVSRQHASA